MNLEELTIIENHACDCNKTDLRQARNIFKSTRKGAIARMIEFKLTSRDGSKSYYKFAGTGLHGIIVIDTITLESDFSEVDGFLKDNEQEKQKLLYIARRKLKSLDFPESCIYATH